MEQLTSNEQHIFELLEIIEQTRQQDENNLYLNIVSDIIEPLSKGIIELEMKNAYKNFLVSAKETENDDSLCENLERLFCSRQKSDFLLAKQLLWGLILSEKALFNLIKSVYNFYVFSDENRFRGVYGHEVRSIFSRIKALKELEHLVELTEEEKKQLPELELKTKKQPAKLFYLSMVGKDDVVSRWLV